MELVRSNRTEILVDALASKVRANPLPALEKETIVVQSRGLERWLTLELARRLGVWANPSFPFPRHLIERVLAVLDPESEVCAAAYHRERLKWTIAHLLSESPPPSLRGYLESEPDRILRFAGSVASVLDDYVVYRPELLTSWAQGHDDGWESEVWRRLVSKLGPYDLASRVRRGLERLTGHAAGLCIPRLHLFSMETLPPQFLCFFGALSKHVPTTLYALEPSREFLGDMASSPQLALPFEDDSPDGHPFFIGAGTLASDFQQLLYATESLVGLESELFEEPGRDSLLRSFQTDILNCTPAPSIHQRREVAGADESISVHACSGPMREMQVLHDLVRGTLEADSTMRPEDVVVMAPELETYGAYFRAVFGETSDHRIPFHVHDRRSREDSRFYDDFRLLLELLDSRFSVLDLVRLLDANTFREDYSFGPDERARLTDLLAASGIRWGIDGEHRAEEGFPKDELHTWRSGLGRLFLGFSMAPDSTDVFASLLPRGAPTLDDAELIARLSKLCGVLFETRARTRGTRSLESWVDELNRLSDSLFSEDGETSRATHLLRTTLDELRTNARRADFEGEVSLRAVRRELDQLLVANTPAVGFLRRGVTLTEMVPLRSVPFRLVCLVGMSEGEFPRRDGRPSFDRTRQERRRGDRNRRNDDRHSFLQAVLCARDRLIITYSSTIGGHRPEPNASPLVSELSECVQRYYRASDERPVLRPVVHPLHANDPRYFSGSPLPRSFSARRADVARTLSRRRSEPPRVTLSAGRVEQSVITVGELAKWLWHPAKAFIDDVLQARFETPAVYEPDDALIRVGALEAANVGNAAIRSALRGAELATYLAACPEFPDGSLGTLQRATVCAEIEAVMREAAVLRGDHDGNGALVRVDLGELVVEGRLVGLCGKNRVVARFSKLGRMAEVLTWIEHLVMQAAEDALLPGTTHLVLRGTDTKANVVRYGRVEHPSNKLHNLVILYQRCRETPLPLFESASQQYAAKKLDEGGGAAVRDARRRLKSMRRYHPHLEYVLGPNDPFENEGWKASFQEVAVELYGPMFAHRSQS